MNCLCSQTRRAARLLTLLYDGELAAAGLNVSKFELLALLSHGERNGRSIAHALSLDATTVSRNLQSLVADRLIAAAQSRSDARQLRYRLTASGRARLQKGNDLWARAQSRVEAQLDMPTSRLLRTLQMLGDAALQDSA